MHIQAASGKFQRAFSPILIHIGNADVGDLFTIKVKGWGTEFVIEGQAYQRYQKINIGAYVQSLLGYKTQCVRYEVLASGTGFSERSLGNFYAIRSAAQLGEATNVDGWCGKILTDLNVLYGYGEYPLSVNILGDEYGTYSCYDESALIPENRFKAIFGGFYTRPIIPRMAMDENGREHVIATECQDQSIWVRPSTDNVRWSSYQCQQYYVANYTVRVMSGDPQLGTAHGGGTIEFGSSTHIVAKGDSEDILFEAWYYNGVRREDISREQDFFPTEDCTLVARFILSPNAHIRWDIYQCQEEIV